ncbi:MAG: hypothetical protein ABI443_13970 [Chthoniobacterales bacterium]
MSVTVALAESPSPSASPAATAQPSPTATPVPSSPPASNTGDFVEKKCEAIKTTLAMPKGWFFLELKNPDGNGASYVLSKEKVSNEYDSFKTGMTLNVIKDVIGQVGMKPSEYAKSLIEQDQEKDNNSKMQTSEETPFKIFKTTQTIDTDDGKLIMQTLFKANDQTGTLYHFTWQYPQKEEAMATEIWAEILKRSKLDPAF